MRHITYCDPNGAYIIEKLGGRAVGRYADAAKILDELIENPGFELFLTIPAYAYLD